MPEFLKQIDAEIKISHVVRKAHDVGKQLFLDTYNIKGILDAPLPRPRQQADLLVQWMATNSPAPGEPIDISFQNQGSVVGAKSDAGLWLLIDHLSKIGFIDGPYERLLSGGFLARMHLTFDGWEHYETLRLGSVSYGKAFMAMKFGEQPLNMMLESVFRPKAKQAGFDLIKLDDNPRAGLIDDRLRVEIRSADFVIADLSHDNLGAYWEAGYAEGLGKPVIYTCEKNKFKSSRTHFDTNHHLTIVWDIDEPNLAGDQLVQTIRATLPHLAKLVDD
ncbi:hypothetical protein [Methylomonas sp. UP202]|uniref:hypothetical protein n=1 Tax=Methylomonas sp. UP202 TaxID=3040943 RepID=UPI002479FA04|nr:hypothetical protein [Methylomonas sp. UP202]WGS85202.1 hypothetical protein QC632_19460 [Methylomonas sp. UP202]